MVSRSGLLRPGILFAAVSLAATGTAAARTAPTATPAAVTDYCQGQCNDILPPGENGNATLADILLSRTLGTNPASCGDQRAKYASLVDGYTGLTNATIGQFFGDASFG